MSNDILKVHQPGVQRAAPSNVGARSADVKMQAEQNDPRTPAQRPALAAADIQQVAQRIESYLKSVGRALEFRVDAGSGRTVVSVRDSETGDLIRQIPNEEVLRFAELAEDQTVVLIKESA